MKMLLRFVKDGQTWIQVLLLYNSWSENEIFAPGETSDVGPAEARLIPLLHAPLRPEDGSQ